MVSIRWRPDGWPYFCGGCWESGQRALLLGQACSGCPSLKQPERMCSNLQKDLPHVPLLRWQQMFSGELYGKLWHIWCSADLTTRWFGGSVGCALDPSSIVSTLFWNSRRTGNEDKSVWHSCFIGRGWLRPLVMGLSHSTWDRCQLPFAVDTGSCRSLHGCWPAVEWWSYALPLMGLLARFFVARYVEKQATHVSGSLISWSLEPLFRWSL